VRLYISQVPIGRKLEAIVNAHVIQSAVQPHMKNQ
jgi:hypothetical protein